MLDALLNIVIASNNTPAEAELDMTDALVVKITLDGHLSCQSVLDTRLLELAKLVIAFTLEQV